jgi:gliding motility-associated protein GldL
MAGANRKTEIGLNVVVCVGASIVIIGALFKILHWPGADTMLQVGLFTEAGIFFIYAFFPPPPSAPLAAATTIEGGNPALKSLEKMIHEADITPTNLQKLSVGFQKLGTTVEKIGEIGDVVKSTGDFTTSTKSATEAMVSIKDSVLKSASAIQSFGEAGESTRDFHGQVQILTKNLGSLNAIYELELQDTNNHLKEVKSFYGNLAAASQTLKGSLVEAQSAHEQIALLGKNLNSLNNVYGNILSAMQGRS